jgi:hypothetical protein
MAAAREQATRGWLELRDAVLAWWRVPLVLTQLVLMVTPARSDEQSTRKLPPSGNPVASDSAIFRMSLRAPRPPAPPQKSDEALEPPAFDVKPAIEEDPPEATAETGGEATSSSEVEPAAPPAPALSLEVPERPAMVLPRRMESVGGEGAFLSHAAEAPTISEAPTVAEAPRPAAANASTERSTAPEVVPTGDDPPAEVDVLSLIRMEIKQRLPYFEGCARSARRRNGVELRRLQATWAVAPDGSIKSMKIDGIDDPELGACIARVGSRPFTTHPGADLVIPTPIVFVR